VVALHASTLILILLGRRNLTLLTLLFLLLLASVLAGELINERLAANFTLFSRQQYFDSSGMFYSLIWSLPALVNCIVILVNWFLLSGSLLVQVKRKELELKAKKEKKE
jgi:hypothetical protein